MAALSFRAAQVARALAREHGLLLEDLTARATASARAAGRDLVQEADVVAAVERARVERPASDGDDAPRPAELPRPDGEPAERSSEERVVRVFVSSTFRDLQAERDELVKRVFPVLREVCESRGVTWGEVDLRWGITDEEAAEGQVLPVCLAEIDRCRPFFIGLLGGRYGWVPDDLDPELLATHPWLADHRGRSVTELEMLHGALNEPDAATYSFFYLRDEPDGLPGPATPEARLAQLRERIEQSGLPVRHYADPEAVGALVGADLRALLDRLYPPGPPPDPFEQATIDHEAFARSRTRAYIRPRASTEALEAHARGDGPPLIVVGEPGAGKSSLLANWAVAHRQAHPDVTVVTHFTGSSSQDRDWPAVLRRLVHELSRRLHLETPLPSDVSGLPASFANVLHRSAASGRVVLVLDGLDQLADRAGGPDLGWLPPEIPDNVRVVVSAEAGPTLDELTRRGWTLLEVEPLERAARDQLIETYLAQHRKRLSAVHADRIASAPRCANPLYLRTLLDELRLWGDHEHLADRIDHYLTAGTTSELYRRVLERWEADYERDRPGLVADALTALWAARRGLSEAELLDLLGAGDGPLPAASWAPFALAAAPALVQRGGSITFAHGHLRRAVRDAYLPTAEAQAAAHLRLADYFEHRRDVPRGLDELPWQLAEGGAWERLRDLLVDPAFFTRAWGRDEFDVKALWVRIEAASNLRLVDAYGPVAGPLAGRDPAYVHAAMRLLGDTGHVPEALDAGVRLCEVHRARGDDEQLTAVLDSIGYWLDTPGERLAVFREQERLARSLGDPTSQAHALIGQVAVAIEEGELDRARTLLDRHAELAARSGDLDEVQRGLGNRAVIHARDGEFDAAEELLVEKERLARRTGDLAGVASALHNRACVEVDRGEPAAACSLFEQSARTNRRLGDRATLLTTLLNWGKAAVAAGRLDDAVAPLEEAVTVADAIGAATQREEATHLLDTCRSVGELDDRARSWLQEHRREPTPDPAERSVQRARYEELRAALRAGSAELADLTELGWLCVELDELAEAEAVLGQVLDADPTFHGFEALDAEVRRTASGGGSSYLPLPTRRALCYLGFVHERRGRHQLGEAHVLDATFGSQDAPLLVTAGRFYLTSSSPEVDTAIAYFAQAIAIDPGLIAVCDDLVDAFVAAHRALYPRSSWAVIERTLEIWASLKRERSSGSPPDRTS